MSDESGNTDVETVVITIEDNIDPIIICIDNQTVDADASHTYTVQGTEFDPESTEDYCNTTIINDHNSQSTLAGASFDEGTTTVEWTVTDVAGNSAICSFNVFVNAYVDISELGEIEISMYPNPTKGVFYVEAKNMKIIEISNIVGQEILEINVENEKTNIDLSTQSKGIYLVKIVTDNGILVKKLVIE